LENGLGSSGRAEARRRWPPLDLVGREVDPVDDQVEELELKRGEQDGQVSTVRERVPTVQIAGVDRGHLVAQVGRVVCHLPECGDEIADAAVLREQQPDQRLGFERRRFR
jgi:hypothetical protein